ncbi:hypothetical protein [Cytobacillus praedii]|nr:hypothetical protein [Cytobacillus praedii]
MLFTRSAVTQVGLREITHRLTFVRCRVGYFFFVRELTTLITDTIKAKKL